MIVNMCREWGGNLEECKKLNIAHVHVPTADVCEPSFEGLVTAVDRMMQFANSNKGEKKIFVHCKGGRGRAVTVAVCFLIKQKKITASEAFELVSKKRHVAEKAVLTFSVVKKFEAHVLDSSGGDDKWNEYVNKYMR